MKISLPSNESGNILFLILIAVALFAALSYAVTSSSRSSSKNISAEEIRLAVNQFEQFKSTLTPSYMRLLLNDCSEAAINLKTPLTPSAGMLTTHGTSGTIGSSCDLFSKNGGGVIFPITEVTSVYPIYFNNPKLHFGVPFFLDTVDIGALTNGADLIVTMLYDSTDKYAHEVCRETNKRRGMPDIDDTAAINALMTGGKLPTDMFCVNQNMIFVIHPH